MSEKKTSTIKFPKDFFTSIKPCKINHSSECKEIDKPFEWSDNVLKGKTKVTLVSNKLVK